MNDKILVYLCLAVFFGLPLAAIGLAYWFDYKAGKKALARGINSMGIPALLLLLFVLGSPFLQKDLFPLCINDHNYNPQRLQKGIPPIEDDWTLQENGGHRYLKIYAYPYSAEKKHNIHIRKYITYNLWGPEKETDIFRERDQMLVTEYDYTQNRTRYARIVFPAADSGNVHFSQITGEQFKTILDRWMLLDMK